VKLRRVYFVCARCRLGRHGADERVGICGARTRQAERMLCLAGASWSFANASRYLRELSGLSVSASSVRQVCQQEAPRIDAWQATPAAAEKYRTSRGHDEFQTDGICVNTDQGWKEMRVGVFAKRMPGAAAAPHEWATRKLPAPAARVAFAALEDHRTFAARWPVVASRLGIRAGAQLDVLADGARWIWERVDFHFAFAQGTLDIYHALEHVGQTAQALFGEGTTEAARWQAGARDALLGEGWPGIQRVIDPARVVAVGAPQRTAVRRLADYLRPHAQHLDYRKRLASGRPIGSGCIEGACKNYLGRRLKQTGARWLIPNANRMATLGSLVYADQWTDYWANSN
jgi:hypothetical protein